MNFTKSQLIRVLSPLLFFVVHVAYLVGWSKDAFLNKWIDGSFTFFLALVMCNVIRARIVAAELPEESPDETDPDDRAP